MIVVRGDGRLIVPTGFSFDRVKRAVGYLQEMQMIGMWSVANKNRPVGTGAVKLFRNR